MDLLTLAKSRINLETLTDLADLLGIDANAVPQLVDEALPAILGIFKVSASDPEKAALLDEIVANSDESLLDDPAATLEKEGPSVMKTGKSTLARLLGPNLTDHIAPVAKSTGLGEGKVASAFGVLTPFVSSLLARHANNASELHELLAEQDLNPVETEPKAKPQEPKPEKSYLPDPNKPKLPTKRPRRKMIAALIVLILAFILTYVLTRPEKPVKPDSIQPNPEIPTDPAPQTPETESIEDVAYLLIDFPAEIQSPLAA
ncbi:MAG: DUF937 domain-containing protein [Verrucomicrobiota bacterium JB023]|nr:DUF937 domain-containing protein [Verrucomicrobiota bacterium JB023]